MNLKEYFEFSKKEFNGLIILCILLVFIALAPQFYTYLMSPPTNLQDSSFVREVDEFMASVEEEETNNFDRYKSASTGTKEEIRYFSFNPNDLPESDWLRLGLSMRQIKVIKNFEAKGGRFYKKEDLKKIYSIREDEYFKLEPYIVIPASNNAKPGFDKNKKPAFVKVKKLVDINKADSSELEALRGIGPAFASRILKYRNRLGGFCKKEQLLEVYGMDSVKYKCFQDQLTIGTEDILKININSATFNDLRKYPYLSYKQINAILQYRNQHGNYQSSADLKKVLILTDEVIAKVLPYLTF